MGSDIFFRVGIIVLGMSPFLLAAFAVLVE